MSTVMNKHLIPPKINSGSLTHEDPIIPLQPQNNHNTAPPMKSYASCPTPNPCQKINLTCKCSRIVFGLIHSSQALKMTSTATVKSPHIARKGGFQSKHFLSTTLTLGEALNIMYYYDRLLATSLDYIDFLS